ncbi:Alpha/Beta hydrolase protein [Aspergillus cavernicola]|uniref:Alpha/Beta hydrolase protein n=1 Tax=Aspergillus cavernicola TaxID=176166 RepID=A0ABR4IRU2_9EURO
MPNFITINNAHLAYTLHGPKGTPLIITLHGGRGFGDHSSDFTAYAPLSNNNNYRVLSFTYRGHGASSRTKPYTFQQLVEDIEGLRAHFNGDEPCVIIGGSFGGFLALQYAIQYPHLVSHLILRGTAASYHHEEAAIQTLETRLHRAPGLSVSMLRKKIFGRFETDEEFRLVMHAAAPLYTEPDNFDPDVALRRTLETVFNAEAHNDLYSESEKYFDYRAQLGSITAKTLVIVGDKDWICPPSQSEVILQDIPGAKLVVVSGAGHSVHVEKNEVVLRAVRGFLGGESPNL